MRNSLLFLVLFMACGLVSAQEILDNNPPSLKWYQVNTKNFRVLFPKGFEEQGQRVANNLEYIHGIEAKSMGTPPRKISVILQNQSSVSNGFVTILPRRSEFYTMPTQNYNFVGTNDWLNLLTSHEYRHVVQYQHATRGFNRLFYYLFGSTTLAGMAQAAAPQWFWEGDAVATETAFTNSGRGRIPYFGLVFRTNLLEGRTFNYHKQYLRSYRNNIPDHYVLGFHMVSYLRKRTNDPDIWSKVTARSWSVPFIPFAFSNALKKETGLYVTGLYRSMAADLQKEWRATLDTMTLTPFQKINNRRNSAYTDYLYPQAMADGNVLVMKRGIGDIEQFVLVKNGEEKVFTPGVINDSGMLSAENEMVVWNEYGFNPRYTVKNYSLIKTFDLKTKHKLVIGDKHSRYGSAAISPQGDKIVSVRTNTQYKTNIVILNYPSGNIIHEFDNPQNDFYSMPRWSDDGKKIVVLKTNKSGKSVEIFQADGTQQTEVLAPGQENIGYPVLYKNYVLYNSPVSGIDNIYALDLNTNKRYKITNSKYGALNPSVSPNGESIFYNDQSRDGLDVVSIPFNPSTWKLFSPQREAPDLYQHLVEQEGRGNLFDSIPQHDLPIKKYSKLKGIINPYTWGFYVDNSLTQASLGIASRDILSTTAIDLGYVFDINERTAAWRAKVSYQALLPIIDVTAQSATRSVNEGDVTYGKIVGQDTVLTKQNLTFKWQEKTIEGGLRIPLITTSSKYLSHLSFSDYAGYTSISGFKNNIDGGGRLFPANIQQYFYFYRDFADHGNLIYNHFTFTGYRLLKRSRRDINSKWGQLISAELYNTPFGGNYSGNQFSFISQLFFPGLQKHHSIWGYWAYQHTQIDPVNLKTEAGLNNYIFRNRIPLPRGHSISRFVDFYAMSVNYTMPVWYPDIAIGPLLNIQRLRANGFLDYGYGKTLASKSQQTYSSLGIEAKFDINILRFLPQFDIGVRYSYGLTPVATKFEVLIGTFNF
jgi:hypothetical protein